MEIGASVANYNVCQLLISGGNLIPKPKRAGPKVPDPPPTPTRQLLPSKPLNLDEIIPYSSSQELLRRRPSSIHAENPLVRDFNQSQKIDWQQQQQHHHDEINNNNSNDRNFQRAQSIRKSDRHTNSNSENTGDILTKVTIPRSGSFLNAKGLTKYKSTTNR